LNGSVKEPNKFHIYETERITHKACDAAEYIEFLDSSTRDRRARRINVISLPAGLPHSRKLPVLWAASIDGHVGYSGSLS